MAYQPLARKYRPKKFADLVGQDAASKALRSAIKMGREPNAVIFSGVRGVGKTTTARIYAKALNCPNRVEGEPCGVCESCLAVAGGYHEDVLEVDGASHNGVDEVRAIRETLDYVPHRSAYRVYLIDEVHMLSLSAFSALLKALEEPPPHVVFIFATTELHKVPKTILGRCQTFHLQKLTLTTITERITHILNAEELTFAPEAIAPVARQGRGSMRDALTFLDQAIAIGGGKLHLEALSELLGAGLGGDLLVLLEHLIKKDAAACIDTIAQLDQAGCEFREALNELASYARAGFLLASLGGKPNAQVELGLSQAQLEALQALSSQAEAFTCNRLFRTLIACHGEMLGSELDRYIFENHCLEWCLDPGLPQIAELLQAQPPVAANAKPNLPPQSPLEKKSLRQRLQLPN